MHIDPETLDARVPNLLLQPLVENAIRHGDLAAQPAGLDRDSTPRVERPRLIIEIRDSGYGVPPDRLIALNSGVGLGNTRARLEHLYPPAHQFTFSNLEDGFCVTVSIPFRRVDAAAPKPSEAGVA